jgi:hypothetical protein
MSSVKRMKLVGTSGSSHFRRYLGCEEIAMRRAAGSGEQKLSLGANSSLEQVVRTACSFV